MVFMDPVVKPRGDTVTLPVHTGNGLLAMTIRLQTVFRTFRTLHHLKKLTVGFSIFKFFE
ncbi:MAG TPA: hypothetical protein LFW20_06305 [Rickettsia endosymbiont of Omalisus fontisbellaquei]|nr:hypothetical protein [Rickettsia endosymbiont of Omalisus fontisbellaquei]